MRASDLVVIAAAACGGTMGGGSPGGTPGAGHASDGSYGGLVDSCTQANCFVFGAVTDSRGVFADSFGACRRLLSPEAR